MNVHVNPFVAEMTRVFQDNLCNIIQLVTI